MPPAAVSNSEKSICQTRLRRSTGSTNAALWALAIWRRSGWQWAGWARSRRAIARLNDHTEPMSCPSMGAMAAISMTSAPMSAIIRVANGPAATRVKSSTRMPSRGRSPAVSWPAFDIAPKILARPSCAFQGRTEDSDEPLARELGSLRRHELVFTAI